MPSIKPECEGCGKHDAGLAAELMKHGLREMPTASEFRPMVICDDCRGLVRVLLDTLRAEETTLLDNAEAPAHAAARGDTNRG